MGPEHVRWRTLETGPGPGQGLPGEWPTAKANGPGTSPRAAAYFDLYSHLPELRAWHRCYAVQATSPGAVGVAGVVGAVAVP